MGYLWKIVLEGIERTITQTQVNISNPQIHKPLVSKERVTNSRIILQKVRANEQNKKQYTKKKKKDQQSTKSITWKDK